KIKLIERLASDNLLHIRILRDATKGNPEELAASVNKDTYSLTGVPSISSAEPVVEFRLTDTISDLSLTQSQIQNVMSRIEWTAVAMPRNASRGKPVVVAVIDTGVFLQHELFSGLLLPGVDVTNNTPIAAAKKLSDGSYEYHGTTTAGIIALMIRGGKINGPAIANVKILPIRATSSVPGDQRISSPALIKAIDYAMRHGANIINASFGDVVNSQDVKDKIAAAGSANVLLVAAAGNGQRTSLLTPFQGYNIDVTPFYPASYRLPNIVSVAALSVDDSLAQFSNWGPKSVLI
ncbi:S8 family serine peptidase, partial [Burkholderia contaminans]|uniref:S8 family serine peptidase n=1 Tax=Burkholderia contaminans TaxID=488447 RepID=UPI002D7F7370